MPPLVLPHCVLERLALTRELRLPISRRIYDEVVNRMADPGRSENGLFWG